MTGSHSLGEPKTFGPLTTFPIFGPKPILEYLPLTYALNRGAEIKELGSGADVRTVAVENPAGLPVLVYEGQQIKGGQQNRTFDTSFLVPARSQVTAPVSCVERGRWDGLRHADPFTVSTHSLDPAMRATRREQSNAEQGNGRPDQGAVWEEVDNRLAAFEVASTTDALEDLYAKSGGHIGAARQALVPEGNQVGTLVQLGDKPMAIDLVSRPEAFNRLAGGLVSGYAVLCSSKRPPGQPDAERALRFLGKALAANRAMASNVGMGHGFTASTKKIVGGGVEHDGELIAFSAFRRKTCLPRT